MAIKRDAELTTAEQRPAKDPHGAIERGLIPEKSLVIGTHVLKLKDPVTEPAADEPILAIVPKVTSNDHEAGSSQTEVIKFRDPGFQI